MARSRPALGDGLARRDEHDRGRGGEQDDGKHVLATHGRPEDAARATPDVAVSSESPRSPDSIGGRASRVDQRAQAVGGAEQEQDHEAVQEHRQPVRVVEAVADPEVLFGPRAALKALSQVLRSRGHHDSGVERDGERDQGAGDERDGPEPGLPFTIGWITPISIRSPQT